MADKSLEIFLIPSPRLGTFHDLAPERVTAGMNEWITLSREVLAKRRAAAATIPAPPDTDITEDHNVLRPFGAQFCPALQEVNTIGYLLKWPANGIFKRVGAKSWSIESNSEFYKFHSMTSFAEGNEIEALSIDLGWVCVTPPGWSTLIKNVPNNLSARRGMEFAEGVLRTDQATVAVQVHCFMQAAAPKEIVITRGEPMCLLMPFRRESLGLAIMNDPESLADANRFVERDQKTFHNAPGRYRALYVEDENPSDLYPKLVARRAAEEKK